MDMKPRSTDAEGRICLPKTFANVTVIIDQVSEAELRIRKAIVVTADDIRFAEEYDKRNLGRTSAAVRQTEPTGGNR
jgi:hypothetical protein